MRKWKTNDVVWAVGHGVEVEKQSTIAVFASVLPAPLQVRDVPSSSICCYCCFFLCLEKWLVSIFSTGEWRLIVFGGCRSSFGIAFDIDGVILRGRLPIGGSPQALRRLYRDSGTTLFNTLFSVWDWSGNSLLFIWFREKFGFFFLSSSKSNVWIGNLSGGFGIFKSRIIE